MTDAAATCWRCEAEWEHCHGTVISHSLRHWECTEADCPGPELVPHLAVIECAVIGCECDQPMGSGTEVAASAAGSG
jgi:hypothetical protein